MCASLVGPGNGGRRGVPSMVLDSCAGQSELEHLQCTLATWPVPSCSILEPSGHFPPSFLQGRRALKVRQDRPSRGTFPRSHGGMTSELRT